MNDETLANSAPRSKSSPLPTKKNGTKMPSATASSRSSWRSSCPEVMPRMTPTVNAARIVSRPSWLATAGDHRDQGEVAADPDLRAGALEPLRSLP